MPWEILMHRVSDVNDVVLRMWFAVFVQDIAFKIVNREWEYSYKRGFRCQFHNNIFQLWFHFKRYRYRRWSESVRVRFQQLYKRGREENDLCYVSWLEWHWEISTDDYDTVRKDCNSCDVMKIWYCIVIEWTVAHFPNQILWIFMYFLHICTIVTSVSEAYISPMWAPGL